MKSPIAQAKLSDEPGQICPDLGPSILDNQFELPKVIVEKQKKLSGKNISFFDVSLSNSNSKPLSPQLPNDDVFRKYFTAQQEQIQRTEMNQDLVN